MSSKIYVAGTEIGRAIQKEDLDEKFGKFGRVVSVWVARQPPGFAFVEFEDARDAEDAIRDMNNTEILGCEITCEPSRGPRDGKGSGSEETKPGDWQCRPCGVNNFARRFECFRCGAPKEGGGGRGGDRYGGGGDRYGGGGGGYRDDYRDDYRGGGGGGYRDDRDRDRYDDRRGGGDRYDDRRRSRSPPRRRSSSRDRRRDSRDRSPARRGDSRDRRD